MNLFFGIFIDALFDKNNEKFEICIKYLFMNLFGYNENPGLSHQVIYTI